MLFQTQYSKADRFPCPSGSRYKDEFQLVTDPDGNSRLEKTGVKDVYQEIQSYKDGCTIENIVRRALNGDLSVLSARPPVYGDTTFAANDLIAANEAIKQAQDIYKTLPADKRSKYGSFDAFVRSFGSLQGIKDFFTPVKKEVAKKEVTNNDAAASV